MENLSRSASKKPYTSNGVGAKTVYDDVFGGPPKFGVPTLSPRVEDYTEIFGGFHASRASSIPILDLPEADQTDFPFDVRSSHFDYSEVFGGFNGLDIAVSFEELFNPSKVTYDSSSDEAWTPAQSESFSDESDPSACRDRNQSYSNGESYQSCDGIKQFNISYDKASQRSKEDISNGMAHVTQLHAVPGFTYVVNETPPPQIEDMNTHLQVTDDLNPNVDFKRGLREGKQFRKTMSQPSNSSFGIQTLGTDLKPVGYGKTASHVNEAFLTVSDFSLRTQPSELPPPSRPPPGFGVKDGGLDVKKSKLKVSRSFAFGEMGEDSSPTFFDVEIDASSSAAVSAAAIKDAMEKAQAKLKFAKELMERKKEGPQSRTKLGFINDTKDKGVKASKIFDGSNSVKDDSAHGTCQRDCSGMKTFSGEERQKVMKTKQVVSDSIDGEKYINMAKISSDKKHGKEYRSSQEAFKSEGTVAWREAEQFFEVVETDKSRKIFEAAKDDRVLAQNTQFHECGHEKKATPFQLQEEDNRKIKADREARERDRNKGRSKATKDSSMQDEKEAEVNEDICKQEENGKKLRMGQQHGDIEKIRPESYKSGEFKKLPEVLLKDNEVEIKVTEKMDGDARDKGAFEREEHEKRRKETLERERYEKRLKAAIERAAIEKKLKEAQDREEREKHREREEKEKREKEAREREEKEKREKEAHEREDKEKRLKEAREIEENEKRIKEAREREENEKRLNEACEREENEKRLKEGCEREENEKRIKEACEREENEKRLEEAREREENGKQLKEVREREEIEKRLEEAREQEENKKRLKEALEQEENENRLKMALEQEENEKKQKLARERDEHVKRLVEDLRREEIEKKLRGTPQQDEIAKNQKEAHEKEKNEERPTEACGWEENEKRIQGTWQQEDNKKRLEGTGEREESEKGSQEAFKKKEIEKRYEANECEKIQKRIEDASYLKELKGQNKDHEKNQMDDNQRKLKSDQGTEAERENLKASDGGSMLDDYESQQPAQAACKQDENGVKAKKTRGALSFEEDGTMNAESIDSEENAEAAEVSDVMFERQFNTAGMAQADLHHELNQNGMKDATESLHLQDTLTESVEGGIGIGQANIDRNKKALKIASNLGEPNVSTCKLGGRGTNVKEVPVTFDKEEIKEKSMSSQVARESIENGRKMGAVQPTVLQGKANAQSPAQKVNTEHNTERKEKNFKDILTPEERDKEERIKRERELEQERLRKIEEEREREREREKDRMAVDRATLEARERVFSEARERAERAAVERATADVRQRVMAEARERLEKASAEARERSLAEKANMEARLRAERAAVERATAEARERAFQKAMAEKERVERSVADKACNSYKNGGIRQNSSFSDLQDAQFGGVGSSSIYSYSSVHGASYNTERFVGVEGESPQRSKARLERHRRTAERAAKALAEKNMRDLLAQREQAERNRLAEALDAEVKRWSSGKEGNLRALLSTLQYILGHDSGWQPIPLTEVITSAACKKAYRKATLCVHPDKLQQRGASIQQKYICEKVFDLLKEAWNKFNSEER